jgi:hypothetical protein
MLGYGLFIRWELIIYEKNCHRYEIVGKGTNLIKEKCWGRDHSWGGKIYLKEQFTGIE